MRPINVTLDSQSWEWAKKKTNFSEWVRNQLRLEEKGHTYEGAKLDYEASERDYELVFKQKEEWYRKYAALRKEIGYHNDRMVKE